jgi:hypothetical protein
VASGGLRETGSPPMPEAKRTPRRSKAKVPPKQAESDMGAAEVRRKHPVTVQVGPPGTGLHGSHQLPRARARWPNEGCRLHALDLE